jgi:hypothetical protein
MPQIDKAYESGTCGCCYLDEDSIRPCGNRFLAEGRCNVLGERVRSTAAVSTQWCRSVKSGNILLFVLRHHAYITNPGAIV